MEKPAIEGGNPVVDENNFIKFCPPKIGKEEIDSVVEVLKSGWLSTGKKAIQFQEDFKKYTGAKEALALNSCTAGLHLALISLGIGRGDEVIVPAMTFAATANVVELTGAKAVFVDSQEDGFNIDEEKIEEKINGNTKAIMPVHFAGESCEMDTIRKVTKENNLEIIEDAAHAIGTEYRGKKIGSFDNLAAFSFYPTKNMTTIEGGMLTCGNEELIERLRVMSLHGMSKNAFKRFDKKGAAHYEIELAGFKYNMPDVSAAIGIEQLKKIDKFNSIRERYANYMYDRLQNVEGLLLSKRPKNYTKHSWHMFPLLLNPQKITIDRDKMLQALKSENIGVGVHYRSLHIQKYYREKYSIKHEDYPRAGFISDNTFSIPFSHSMELNQVEKVCDALIKICNYYKK